MRWNTPGAGWLLSGGLFYFLGTFLVTIFFNVPLNNALAKVTPDDADMTSRAWSHYLSRWTM